MTSGKTIAASLGAIVSSVLTLGCCLPLPFLGAAGLAGASVFLNAARPWLLGLSAILLGAGFFQVYRGMKCRARQSRIALALLALAAMLVIFLLFFPQALAGLLADISSQQKVPVGQRSLSYLSSENFDQLHTAFNKDSGEVRVVLLLSIFALTAPVGAAGAIIASRSSALNKSANNIGDYQQMWKFRRYLLS